MKIFTTLSLSAVLLLFGCDNASDDYRRLLQETGATPEELNKGIALYTDFYLEMKDEIEAGTFSAKEMMDASKQAKEAMAAMQREDEMAALFAYNTLKLMEERGEEEARIFVVGRIDAFMRAKAPSTETSQILRQRIRDYSKRSTSLTDYEE